MKFPIHAIRPNPFRDVTRYPIRNDKIAALRASIHQTGFWDNVVARLDGDGRPEIAYGHHRLEALRLEYPDGTFEVDLIVRDLDDETMLKIMAHENMGEWGTTAEIVHETVRAVILAYAAGRIDLPEPSTDTPAAKLSHAPAFTPGHVLTGQQERPYTATTVAVFLGWLTPSGQAPAKVHDALAALALTEDGLVAPAAFDGLSPTAAHSRIVAARRAVQARHDAAEHARQAAEEAAREAEAAREEAARKRKSAKAVKDAAAKAAAAEHAAQVAEAAARAASEAELKSAAQQAIEEVEARADADRKAADAQILNLPEPAKDWNDLAEQTSRMITAYLEVPTGVGPRLEDLIAHRDRLHEIPRESLVEALRQLSERLADISFRLLEDAEGPAAALTTVVPFKAAA